MSNRLSIPLQVGVALCAWLVLFSLNGWLLAYFDWAPVISWVFLPAAARLLSVMLFNWRGALGIWLGTLLTNGAVFGGHPYQSQAVAAMSALGPLVAVYLTTRWLQVPMSLRGLTVSQLVVFSLVGAVCNVVPHNLFFWAIGITSSPVVGLIPMFIGDILGIVVVLYLLRAVLIATERFARFPAA